MVLIMLSMALLAMILIPSSNRLEKIKGGASGD